MEFEALRRAAGFKNQAGQPVWCTDAAMDHRWQRRAHGWQGIEGYFFRDENKKTKLL